MSLDIEKELFRESQCYTSRLAVAYSDLGRVMIANGRVQGVQDLFEKSEEIRRTLDNFDPLQLYNPHRGIAMVYYYYGMQPGNGNRQREFNKARGYLDEALRVREDRFGLDDTEGGR